MILGKIIVLLIFVLIIFFSLFDFDLLSGNKYSFSGKIQTDEYHKVEYEKELFEAGISSQRKDVSYSGNIKGGIVPHHMLASRIIADFYYNLSKTEVNTIIILGPNHYQLNREAPLSSKLPWMANEKIIKTDSLIIDELMNKGLIKIDDQVLEKDHAIGSHIPFIEYYIPEVKIVPILFSLETDLDQAYEFATELEKYSAKDGVVIVSSVDFSHYLTGSQARLKDAVTLTAMENFDFERLYSFNSDNLDSAASISILLYNMSFLGLTDFSVIENSNSTDITKNNDYQTTSYFHIMFFDE